MDSEFARRLSAAEQRSSSRYVSCSLFMSCSGAASEIGICYHYENQPPSCKVPVLSVLRSGRNGPPGADYYTLPALMPLGTLLKASYLHDNANDDIQAVGAAIDQQHQRFNAALLIQHRARKLSRALLLHETRCPSCALRVQTDSR